MGQSLLTYPMIEREITRQLVDRGMISSYKFPSAARILFGPNGFRVEWKGQIYDRAFEEGEEPMAKSLDDFSASYITPLLDQINGKDPSIIT